MSPPVPAIARAMRQATSHPPQPLRQTASDSDTEPYSINYIAVLCWWEIYVDPFFLDYDNDQMCPDVSRNQNTLCIYPQCNKPVWKDPDGSFSQFCGRTHRDGMPKLPSQPSVVCKVVASRNIYVHVTYHLFCQGCQSRPVYVENGHCA